VSPLPAIPGGDRSPTPIGLRQALNTGTPGQNIPGGAYNGFSLNNEFGFILPAATGAVSGISYTAGLTDCGSRLKGVFTNIPSGVQ
jgi:hypothetical protein